MGAFHFTHQLRPKWPFVINFKADLSLGTLTYRLSVGSELQPTQRGLRPQQVVAKDTVVLSIFCAPPEANTKIKSCSFSLDENSKNDGLSVFGNDVHKSFWTMPFTTDSFVRSFPQEKLTPDSLLQDAGSNETMEKHHPETLPHVLLLVYHPLLWKTSQTGIISIVGDVTVEVAPFQKLC